jgi:4-hydroxy-4-methyl-2-oxoglutarate aldolase
MSRQVVVRKVDLPPADAVAALEKYGVSTVHEAQGRIGLLASYMRPIFPGASIAGPAVTVSLPPGDNLMIHVAVEVCTPGSILVVAPTSPCTDGYFGELLGTSLRAHGVKGLVIEAGCRDVGPLNEIPHLEPRDQLAGNGESHARIGERADRVRRSFDPSG